MVRGRLWRRTNPELGEVRKRELTSALSSARSRMGHARRRGDEDALKAAAQDVHDAKIALGERGPVWWTDGAPDLNRHMARTTPYAAWWAELEKGGKG